MLVELQIRCRLRISSSVSSQRPLQSQLSSATRMGLDHLHKRLIGDDSELQIGPALKHEHLITCLVHPKQDSHHLGGLGWSPEKVEVPQIMMPRCTSLNLLRS